MGPGGAPAGGLSDTPAHARAVDPAVDDGPGRRVGRRALTAFDEALRLWRGPSLADVGDAEWALAEQARLEELRLGALEDRFELLLEAGRHTEVVADLERLVADNPLRERLQRLLMLAFYRGSRQADSLAAYHALRHRLGDEFGIDPAPDLQALAEAILRQEVPAQRTERMAYAVDRPAADIAPPLPPPPRRRPLLRLRPRRRPRTRHRPRLG